MHVGAKLGRVGQSVCFGSSSESDEFKGWIAEISEEFCWEYEKLDLIIKKRRKRKKQQIKMTLTLMGFCGLALMFLLFLCVSVSGFWFLALEIFFNEICGDLISRILV